MAMRSEVQLVRETLEEVLAPAVATAVLFDAIERWGHGVPSEPAHVVDLVEGPLTLILAGALGEARAAELRRTIVERLAGGADDEMDLDIDVTESLEDDARTMEITKVPHPVSVLVVGADDGFAARMLAAIGPERLYVHTVHDEPAFRHATFSATPLIVVVDATHPAVRPPELAAAVRQLPDAIQTVVWGAETSYGHELRARHADADGPVMFIDRSDGIEPLLDLVLSRFKRTSTIPPPRL